MLSRGVSYLQRHWVRFVKKRRRLALKVNLYDLGFLIVLCSLLAVVMTKSMGSVFNGLLTLASVPLVIALCIEIHGWICNVERWTRDSVYGKALMAGLLTMSASLSAGYSSTLINEFSSTASNPFPYTTTFVAVPATLAVAFGLVILLYVGFVIRAFGFGVWSMLIGYVQIVPFFNGQSLQRSRTRLKRRTQLEFMRLMAMVMLFLAITYVSPWFEKALVGVAQVFAYRFETYANDPCAKSGERVVRVSDDLVLVAIAKKWTVTYTARQCPRDIGLTPTN
jgi:hypothetical protein